MLILGRFLPCLYTTSMLLSFQRGENQLLKCITMRSVNTAWEKKLWMRLKIMGLRDCYCDQCLHSSEKEISCLNLHNMHYKWAEQIIKSSLCFGSRIGKFKNTLRNIMSPFSYIFGSFLAAIKRAMSYHFLTQTEQLSAIWIMQFQRMDSSTDFSEQF